MNDPKEQMGLAIDRVANASAALKLSLPPAMHVSALRELLPEVVADLQTAYVALTGDDLWGTHPSGGEGEG